MNSDLSVEPGHNSDPKALNRALRMLERSIDHDYLVVVVSDLYGWDAESEKILRRISQHNDLICSLVFDPLERDISSADKLVVSDGRYQLEVVVEVDGWSGRRSVDVEPHRCSVVGRRDIRPDAVRDRRMDGVRNSVVDEERDAVDR